MNLHLEQDSASSANPFSRVISLLFSLSGSAKILLLPTWKMKYFFPMLLIILQATQSRTISGSPRLLTMTYNTWLFGLNVENGFQKIVKSIVKAVEAKDSSTAWIIGLQEVVGFGNFTPEGIATQDQIFASSSPRERRNLILTLEKAAQIALQNLVGAIKRKENPILHQRNLGILPPVYPSRAQLFYWNIS